MKNMLWFIAVGMALVPPSTRASSYVPSNVAWLKASNSSPMNPTAWPNDDAWKIEGDAASFDRNYGVTNVTFRLKIGTATFPGKSLTVGALDGSVTGGLLFRTSNNCDTTFGEEGLFLYAGTMQSWNPGNQIVRGRVTVRSPEGAPVAVSFCQLGASLTFADCPVESAAGAGMYVHSLVRNSNDQSQTNFVARFLDDALSAYYGTITLCPVYYEYRSDVAYYTTYKYNNSVKPPYYVTFKTDSGTMPGSLKLYPNAIIAAETSTTDFSVGSLSSVSLNGYGTNYLSVALAEDGSTCSVLRVTDTLDLQAPMGIWLSTGHTPNKAVAERLAILKAPSGVTLDAARFFMERRDALPYLPDYELEVAADAADGLSTLWLVRSRPVVWTVASDGYQQTFYTRGNNFWSDNAAASNAKDYLALHAIRTPLTTDTAARVFPGHSLSMTNGISLSLCSPVVRLDDLRIWNGVIANLSNGDAAFDFMEGILNGSWVLGGRIRLASDGTLTLNCYNSKGLRIDSDISGGGHVEAQNPHQNNSGTVTSSPRKAFVGLFGSNVDFEGTITVKQSASGTLANRLGSNLAITNACNLGGPRPQWTYDALTLQNCCALHPLNSLTLDEATCGIYLSGAYAFFTVTNDVVFTCKERITYSGTLIKEGAGELALGGPQPYFVSDGTITPTANKNVLDIWDGTLRPVSAAAFQGLAVVVTNVHATLAMDVPAANDDGDIGQYGMLNTTWDAPLTVPDSGLIVQLRDPLGVLESMRGTYQVPICTVNATARAALDGKLFAKSPSGEYGVSSCDWTDNGDGSSTLVATLRHRGFLIIIR